MTAVFETVPTGPAVGDIRDDRRPGEKALDDARAFLARFVKFPTPAALDVATLWAAHTHVVDGKDRLGFYTTPRLGFFSDEPGSGKTRAMQMVCKLSHKGKILLDVTAPSFAEEMHDNCATVGLDEIDILFGVTGNAKSVLRSLINGGYQRDSAWWTRKGQDDKFIFGPVVMAGLARTYRSTDAMKSLRSRTIPVTMTRSGGQVERYRPALHDALAAELQRRLGKWVSRYTPQILEEWPELPDGVDDRDAELWEPLFMVARVAGGHWPQSVWQACEELALGSQDNAPEELPLSQQLLADLRVIFGSELKMPTAQIVQRLYDLPGSQWRRLWPDSKSAPRELSTLLGPNGGPTKIRVGDSSVRGYERVALEELWVDVPERAGVPDVPDDL